MSDTDRQWFRQKPSANFRVRRPVDGEVEEIARRMSSRAVDELTANGEALPVPKRGTEWQILVIKASPDIFVRMLTLRDVGAEAPAPDVDVYYAVAVGDRLAIDRKG